MGFSCAWTAFRTRLTSLHLRLQEGQGQIAGWYSAPGVPAIHANTVSLSCLSHTDLHLFTRLTDEESLVSLAPTANRRFLTRVACSLSVQNAAQLRVA